MPTPAYRCNHHGLLATEDIYVHPNGTTQCRICKRANYRKYYQANLSYHRDRTRKWNEAHPERVAQTNRRWNADNPEKKRAYVRKANRKWRASHPEKSREPARKWRARTRDAEATFKPWMERYYHYRQDCRCFYCGETMLRDVPRSDPRKENLEHMIPLCRGGAHNWINTVLAWRDCNLRKGTRTSEEF